MAVERKKTEGRKFNTGSALLAGLIAALFLFALAPADRAEAYSNPDFFLKQGVGARQLGMGSTGTAIADDASAVFFNPAGLADLTQIEQSTMHSQAFDFDIKYDFASLVLPIVRGKVLAVSGAVLRTDQIPITKDKIPNIVNYTEDKEQVAMYSYGQKISRRASVGLTVKSITQQLYFKEAKGTEADFGILYKPSRTISLGLNLQDITPGTVKWTTGVADEIPFTIRGGIAFRMRDWGSLLTLDVDKVEGRSLKYNGGWEYQFNETFLARLGMNDGQGTAGFSVYLKNWRFDYAYMKADLGEVQRLSATARFGSFLFEKMFRGKRPSEPQCGQYQLESNAKCDKTALVNGQNPNSRIASYPKAGATSPNVTAGASAKTDCVPCATGSKLDSKQMVRVPGLDVAAPQPDINKLTAKDNSPVVEAPLQKTGLRAPSDKIALGNKLVLAGRYDEAARAYRESLNMNPRQEEAHVKLAGIYQYQKLYAEAIEEYKEAIAINPTNADNYISISSLYAKVGAFDKAFEACDIVTKMSPGTDKARTAQRLCDTFVKQGAPAPAVASSRMTLKTEKFGGTVIEEDDAQLALEITPDEEPVKKVSKSSKSKKSSSKAKRTASKNTKKKSDTDKLKSARADARTGEDKETNFLD